MWYHIGCIGAVFPGGIRAIVAQLDRAFGSDPEGQRFEPPRSHQKGMTFLRHAFFLCLFLHAGVLSGPACRGSDCGRFSLFFIGLFYGFVNNFVSF